MDCNDKEENPSKWQCIELIMGSDYFDGLKMNAIKDSKSLIFNLCTKNRFDYMSVIVKYSDKNKDIIINGINYKSAPLINLLQAGHCSEEWLNLLFEASENVGARISMQVLQYAVKEYGKRYKNEKFKEMVQAYMKKHYK